MEKEFCGISHSQFDSILHLCLPLFLQTVHGFLSHWTAKEKQQLCNGVSHILSFFTVGHETSAPQLHQPGWAKGGVDFDLT